MSNNFNIDQNTINKLNDMMKNGDVSKIMSNIPPEMLDNFSKMMNNSDSNSPQSDNTNTNTSSNACNNNASTTISNIGFILAILYPINLNNFDFGKIDINTIMKAKNIMEKMNNSNDPRSNLLASLKPYLRENKKEKLDQYANLMNFTKIAEILKADNNFNNNSNTEKK